MKTATSGFISAISDSCPYHTVKFYLLGAEIDVIVKSFNYYGILSSTDGISIGNTCSSYCEFELYNNNYNLENNEVQIKIGVDVNGTIEYISLGYFTIKNLVKENNIIKYTAFDRMILLEDKYSPSSVSNLTTVSIINDMCSQLGFEFENTLDAISVTKSIVGYTYREMFGFISALHGANCIFNDSGKLEFVWFTQPSSDLVTIDESVMYENGLELTSNSSFKVKYMKCATGETIENTTTDENGEENTETSDVILSVGSGTTGITLSNPLMTQEILTNIYNTYFFNFEYQPCTVKRLGNILLEVGDIVNVNLGTKSYSVPIMTIQHSIDGGVITDLVSLAETETEQSISYESPTQRYIAQSVGTQIQELSANIVTEDYISKNYAKFNLVNIEKGCITNAMIKDATISSAKIVDLNANKINAGTLSCDRLLFNGSDKSIVYYLNNMGNLVSEEVNTINGDTLTDRTITADKIVANSITANEINVIDLFARDISASGTITGLTIKAGTISGGSLFIGNSNGTYASIDKNGKLNCYGAYISYADIYDASIHRGTISNASIGSGTIGNFYIDSTKLSNPSTKDLNNGEEGCCISKKGIEYRGSQYTFKIDSSGNCYSDRLISNDNLIMIAHNSISADCSNGNLVIGYGNENQTNIYGTRINFLCDTGNLDNRKSISFYEDDYGKVVFRPYYSNDAGSAIYLGSDTYRWEYVYGNNGNFNIIYENGSSLSSKYADKSHTSHSAVYSDTNVRIGNNGVTSTEYALATYWKDGSVHNLASRGTDGLTAHFGWPGSSSYKSICNLRGQSIRCNGSTTWSSDENLKKDFNTFDEKYDVLFDNLRPITYKYVLGTSDRYHVGFKTQDVEKALEIANLTTKDFAGVVIHPINSRETETDENGNIIDIELSESNYLLDKGINEQHNLAYIEFIALNTWQIQKLKTKVKEQQNEIEILKQRLENVEQKVGGNSAS